MEQRSQELHLGRAYRSSTPSATPACLSVSTKSSRAASAAT